MLNVLLNELNIVDALRNFVPYVQFKKRENHPWRSDTFSKVAEACNFAKSNTAQWKIFTFFKLHK